MANTARMNKEITITLLTAFTLICCSFTGIVIRTLTPTPGSKDIWSILYLAYLPEKTQNALVLLMLLVIGAVLTAVTRNLIGIQTFGTFTPPLLALSFINKHIFTGIMISSIVFFVGIACRFILGHMRILLVPRLGLVLLTVVICLTFTVAVMEYAGIAIQAHSILLPAVVFTMLIERFHLSCEEKGLGNSLKILTGTIGIAIACIFIFNNTLIRNSLLQYPETLLTCGALLVLIGKYSGFRFTELIRYKIDTKQIEGEI